MPYEKLLIGVGEDYYGFNLIRFNSLCEGKDIDEVEALLKGVICRNGTSCPDQLSKAIAQYKK